MAAPVMPSVLNATDTAQFPPVLPSFMYHTLPVHPVLGIGCDKKTGHDEESENDFFHIVYFRSGIDGRNAGRFNTNKKSTP
jgi:hypothetical protein